MPIKTNASLATRWTWLIMNTICNTYEESISQYLKEALVEAMRFDLEEGNFCDALLEKLGTEDGKNDNSSPFVLDAINTDLELLKKLQTQNS